jgi:hypothetical protein
LGSNLLLRIDVCTADGEAVRAAAEKAAAKVYVPPK